MIDLAKLAALAEKATAIPWTTTRCSNGGRLLKRGDLQTLQVFPSEDADYIAAMNPQTALALLRELYVARSCVIVLQHIKDEGFENESVDYLLDQYAQAVAAKEGEK